MVKVQAAECGIVADIAVVTEHDSKPLVPSVERHQRIFGRVPRVVATDHGFFALDNIRDVKAMGVRCVAVPKPGHRSPAWLARAEQSVSKGKGLARLRRSSHRAPQAHFSDAPKHVTAAKAELLGVPTGRASPRPIECTPYVCNEVKLTPPVIAS
jgi:hypothetical protein